MTGAAIIGTGFIAAVHLGALRRLGVDVRGVLGSSAARGAERAAALGVRAYASLEELLADTSVDVVHVASPNHAHYGQVTAVLASGRHVVCEKPLAMTAAEAAALVDLAETGGRIAAVCYNLRFHALNQHAAQMVTEGKLGDVRLVTGHVHQDWLAKDTDWNWRLEAAQGGTLRSVGDIGTHWLDLVSFVTGLRPSHVFADLVTFLPVRQKPVGQVATFDTVSGDRTATEVTTDDAATILLRFATGARGVFSTSQISFGRRSDLAWQVAGSKAAAAWSADDPDHLWIGHRDRPNETLERDAHLMNLAGRDVAGLPAGHAEGFADTFLALFRQVYRDVAAGARQGGSTYASLADGHFEMRFCEAVEKSAASGGWTEI